MKCFCVSATRNTVAGKKIAEFWKWVYFVDIFRRSKGNRHLLSAVINQVNGGPILVINFDTVCFYRQGQEEDDVRDAAAGRYYLMIMAYVLPGFALLTLFVLLITWRQKLGQLRKNSDGQYCLPIYLLPYLINRAYRLLGVKLRGSHGISAPPHLIWDPIVHTVSVICTSTVHTRYKKAVT